MKKCISLILVGVITIAGLSGCSRNKNVEYEEDYSNDIAEMNLIVDKNEYRNEFETFLNSLVTDNIVTDYNLISPGMIALISDTSEVLDPNLGDDYEAPVDNSGDDLERQEDEQVEYPIVDIQGNTIGYGTKEESDKSFEEYAAAPTYTVESVEIYKDRILFKVRSKSEQQVSMYEVLLNQDMKMESYTKFNIGG